MDINKRIKKIRIDNEISQKVFAERIGIKQAGVSAIEKGIRGVTDRVISDICREFNINEEWIRTGEGEMSKAEVEFIKLVISQLDYLDEMDKKFISAYIKLNPDYRKIFKDFVRKMI